MLHLPLALLAAGLSTTALGAISPLPQAVANSYGTDPDPAQGLECLAGTKICRENYVHKCDDEGNWAAHEFCAHPSWCNAGTDGTAWCVSQHKLKREDAAVPPAPTPSTTRTDYSPLVRKACQESQLRCNGRWEEICDGFGVWQRWKQCSECVDSGNNAVDCVPFTTIAPPAPTPTGCKENQLRCNGIWEEICDTVGVWNKLVQCTTCSDNDGAVDCVPASLPADPTRAAVCVQGALRCDGKFLALCNADLSWERVMQCGDCVTDRDGNPFCIPADVGTPTSPSAAPATLANNRVLTAMPTLTASPATASVAEDDQCVPGEVRCNGDRIEACTPAREWKDFGPCPNCKLLYNKRITCDPDNSPKEIGLEAPAW